MALRSSAASGSYLSRTASIPSIEANYTHFVWFKIEVDTNNFAHVVHMGGPYAYDGNSDFIGTGADGTTMRAGSVVATVGNFPSFDALTVGQWYWVAMVRDGLDSLKIYRGTNGSNGALIGTIATAVGFRPAPVLMALLDYNGGGMNGAVAHSRVWTEALSLAELNAEAGSATPVRTTSLWSHTAFEGADVAAAILDQSGNARHWTANGTLTVVAGPTIGGGSSEVSGNATTDEPTAAGGAESAAQLSGNATVDEPEAGGGAASAAEISGNATTDEPTAGGGLASGASGVFTSEPLSRNNGTLAVSSALTYVAFSNPVTGALVVVKTGLSTDAAGVFVASDPLLVPGTSYRADWLEATGERGYGVKAAA